eukprot:TRINITY_DN78817_c0_g1_i1.p1 TRINITY_DN78817_c0_g1~~TRINITY_DN78817_c0_g1_i1.p1  ORF type:complete len:262 (+),score=37.78 TRINITY_DN78817_c0_g1_i1:68-787(+)
MGCAASSASVKEAQRAKFTKVVPDNSQPPEAKQIATPVGHSAFKAGWSAAGELAVPIASPARCSSEILADETPASEPASSQFASPQEGEHLGHDQEQMKASEKEGDNKTSQATVVQLSNTLRLESRGGSDSKRQQHEEGLESVVTEGIFTSGLVSWKSCDFVPCAEDFALKQQGNPDCWPTHKKYLRRLDRELPQITSNGFQEHIMRRRERFDEKAQYLDTQRQHVADQLRIIRGWKPC